MTVTVDHEKLAVDELGLATVGQVLSYLNREDRLVVQVLLDGQEADLTPAWRNTALKGHTLYIETTDPRQLALEVLEETGQQVREAEKLKVEAAECLQKNQPGKVLEKLAGCLRTWTTAQESVTKIADLLRIDLDAIRAGDGRR